MPQGDSNPRDNRNMRPGDAPRDAPKSTNDPQPTPPADPGPEGSVDFGSYVSSTVRSSAELFGTPARSAPSRNRPSRTRQPRQGVTPETQVTVTSREPAERPERDVPVTSRARPRTYWRDSVIGGRSPGEPLPDDDGDGAGDGGRTGGMLAWSFPEDERTRRIIYAAVALALVALVALVWLLNRGGGDEEPPPTGTIESVLDAAPSATEPDDDGSTPSGFAPFIDDDEETPPSEPTEAVRRGGDNQIDRDDPGTPAASRDRQVMSALDWDSLRAKG